jgi:pimeloyl-ACP methyl ester carboxylesterase
MRLEIISEKPASTPRPVPLLFVHGMGLGAWCWSEHFLPYFSRHGYEAHALSLRGHGGSQRCDDMRWLSLKDYLADVEEAVSHLGRPPVLVGHSMGGRVVQEYLERQRPAAAVLMASVPPTGLFGATWRIFRRQPVDAIKGSLMMNMKPIVETPHKFRELVFSSDVPDEVVSSCYARLNEDSYRVYLEMLVPNLKKKEPADIPMLVLGAGKDMIMSEKDVHKTGRRYGVAAEIFPDMPHGMMLEDGCLKVADRIISWLDSHGI